MKINLGRRTGKKFPHPFTRNVYTTGSFGFLQPIMCREMAAQDSIKYRCASRVRLMPMPKPTFGRVMLKQYTNFVPIESIYHPYAALLDAKPYQGASLSYVPDSVPSLAPNFLTYLVSLCGQWTVFEVNSTFDTAGSQVTTASSIQSVVNALYSSSSAPHFTGITRSVSNFFSAYALTQGFLSYNTSSVTFADAAGAADLAYMYSNSGGSGTYRVLFVRLSDRGRNLRKVLLGLGYQLCSSAVPLTFLPVVAYYKTWFDLFAVQRQLTWKDTNAFSFMECIEQFGYDLPQIVNSVLVSGSAEESLMYKLANFFWTDLADCFYSISPDYASAHISGTAIAKQSSFDVVSGGAGIQSATTIPNFDDQQPVISSSENITQDRLNVLKALYNRINIATAVGGRIKEFMRVVFGSDYMQDEESYFVGANTTYVDVEPVMNTAETAQGSVGEFAGQAYGGSNGEYYSYQARVAGYFISMVALVPEARLCQGIDPNLYHRERYDFLNPDFDAITMVPTYKNSIYACQEWLDGQHYDSGFGNIPNYTEYKVNQDCLNGDMSLKSTRVSYLPFTLAKLLPFSKFSAPAGGSSFSFSNLPSTVLVTGELWRFIGRNRWLGNFDRIFTNSGQVPYAGENQYDDVVQRIDDNFVLYFFQDYNVSSYALPVSDSFQTDPFASAGHVSVEKA